MSHPINDIIFEMIAEQQEWQVHLANHQDRYGQYAHKCGFCRNAQEAERVELVQVDPNAYDADAGMEQDYE